MAHRVSPSSLDRGDPATYDRDVAYDERLADRLREVLAGEPGLTERAMFGGHAFLVDGHLAIAASGQGGALVRVDPSTADALLARPGVELAIMRGRPMDGWLRVPSADLRTRRELVRWVGRATAYVRTLPPKQDGSRPRRRIRPTRPGSH